MVGLKNWLKSSRILQFLSKLVLQNNLIAHYCFFKQITEMSICHCLSVKKKVSVKNVKILEMSDFGNTDTVLWYWGTMETYMAECVLLVQFDDEWIVWCSHWRCSLWKGSTGNVVLCHISIAFLLERTKGLLILSQLGSRCKQGWVSAKYYLMDNHLYPEGIAIWSVARYFLL